MKVIIGLGNPGDEYKHTRHNAGFMAVDDLAKQLGLTWSNNKKCQAELAKNNEFLLVKPMTYMNNSGQAARAVLSYYRLLPKTFGLFPAKNSDLSAILTVIHDDIDIELGKYKFSVDSRSAGHKGVGSIIAHCRTKNFTRLRLGIRVPTDAARRNKVEAAKYVLQKFSVSELIIIKEVIAQALVKIQ